MRRHAHPPSARRSASRGVSHHPRSHVLRGMFVGFVFGVALTFTASSSGWRPPMSASFSGSTTISGAWLDGYWAAQRASRDWCFPREDARAFPLIRQPEAPTALEASPVASGALTEVPRIRVATESYFVDELLSRDRPALIEGLTDTWPSWLGDVTPDGRLSRVVGDAEVRVERSATGRFGHVEPSWTDDVTTLGEFFRGGRCAGEGGDDDDHMYLAFNPPDELTRSLDVSRWPVPCLGEDGLLSRTVRELLVWIGSGTDSTLHNDSWENLFCVVAGRKDVTLLDPAQGAWVGERVGFDRVSFVLDPEGEERARQSGEDDVGTGTGTGTETGTGTGNREASSHAAGRPAGPIAHLEVSVHAGECLYIPSYWFHRVRSPPGTCTVAVTAWFDLLRLTSRFTRAERTHLPSAELKRKMLQGGVPVKCAASNTREEDARDYEE